MTNHHNRSQTYTVLNNQGEVQREGMSLAEAARAVLCYDGHKYDILRVYDADGFELWTSRFSRNSTSYNGLTTSTIFSINTDRALAEADIYRQVIRNAEWFCGCQVMTDDEYSAMVAETREEEIKGLVREALAEDEREGSHFDADGFSQFFPEEDPVSVKAAWRFYDRVVFGGEAL